MTGAGPTGTRRPELTLLVGAVGLGAATLLVSMLTPLPASAEDHVLTSFDDTRITFHWFPAKGLAPGERAPTVLQGPGFGGQGESDPNARNSQAMPGVGPLRRAGYNVLTWNPRGIAPSTGKAELDSPSHEGRDVAYLISWVARQPEARLDGRNDPRVGMTGGSYGGGIQFSTAAIDHRIDAIVPVIAWHSLGSSLYKSQLIKTSWVKLLVAGASLPGNRFDPAILKGAKQADRGPTFSPDLVAFARSAGPGRLVAGIQAPTLIVQGTVDNLFTLQEAATNYHILRDARVPTKMVWYCGGHGICLTEPGGAGYAMKQTWRWLARYLKGRSVSTGAGFAWADQRGNLHRQSTYPHRPTGWVKARGEGRLQLKNAGGSGPYEGRLPDWGDLIRPTVPSRAENAVNVDVRFDERVTVLGAPKLKLTYRGTAGARKARVLAQVVDEQTDTVAGNMITPIRLRLDGRRHTTKVPLEIIGATYRRGDRVTVQVVAQSSLYDTHPRGGSVRFSRIKVALPTS